MPRKLAIVGVGESAGGLVPDRTSLQLHVEAARAALDDAGLGPRDVDGLFSAGVHMLHPLIVCEYMGLEPRYTDSTMTGGGVWEYFVEHAIGAIEAGLCETALLVYGATEASDVRKGLRTGDLAPLPRGPSQFEAPYGLTLIGKYALAARRHMAEFGTTSEQLAEVSVAANRWAQKNPRAYNHGKPITVEDVLSSRMIADPLHRYDCCLRTDGGGAVVLTTEERARDLRKKPIRVLGAGSANSHFSISQWEDLTDLVARESAARAFGRAGVKPSDVRFAMIYDSFTITALLGIEALGFCEKGEGGAFVADGTLAPGGRFPINTDGGALHCSQPGMRGIFLLIEAVRQLRRECGERQVEGIELAAVNGTGGYLSACGTVILGSG
ncbi:MAG: acetyl-CoA acetyltransferase [Candidatus Binatia bacterium]